METHTHTHTHNGILLIHKKERMPFAATWMDVEITTLREESHTKTNIIWYQLYMESKINNTIYLQNKNRLTDIKNKFMVVKAESGTAGIS